MGWFARHVFPIVIFAKAGIRLPARHMGYGREMGSRIRGNDEEGWLGDSPLRVKLRS